MTAQEHREFLESRGFSVAVQPFRGFHRDQLWMVYELDPVHPDRPWHEPLWQGVIHLPTGEFQRTGELGFQPFDQGPWHEQVEPESIAAVRPQTKSVPYGTNSALEHSPLEAPSDFLQLCADAGFEMQSEFSPKAGVFWVRFNGRLEVCYSRSRLVSCGNKRLRAEDLQQMIAARATPAATSPPPPPTPRRSEWNPTAPTQGASKQGSLF